MIKCMLLLTAFSLLSPTILSAELSLPKFFSNSMVLQRECSASIWGKADPGAEVSVTFRDHSVTTRADTDGRWTVAIATGPAEALGSDLVISSKGQIRTISDVLVGEVWLASGQSNMAFTMDRVPDYADLISRANYPGIRMFNAPTVTAVEPQSDIDGEWTRCSPGTVPGYSAVAFFFARKLHAELKVPIGVIKTAWGGKPVETFTSREALMTLPGTRILVDQAMADDAAYDATKAAAAYEARLDQWQAAVAEWRKKPVDQRGRLARKPTQPKRPLDTEGRPGVLFNSMIHPFVGYTMQGAIWYQGEGNAKAGAVPYDQTLPLMIRDWRTRWNDEFSFYFVQLANYRDASSTPGTPDPWPLLQDRMRRVLNTTSKPGMAIINDVGEAKDIHPKNKQAPGERLALWALAKDYGKDLVCCGPLLKSSLVKGGEIHVTFEHAGTGLRSRDGMPLKRFEVAGADRVWHWADTRVAAPDTVIVSSVNVPSPVAVRYAWASNPEGANLVNSEGLPASVFRTDDWDDVESPVPAATANAAENSRAARRALAEEIKTLNAQRQGLKRDSDEFKAVNAKLQQLMEKFKTSAVARQN